MPTVDWITVPIVLRRKKELNLDWETFIRVLTRGEFRLEGKTRIKTSHHRRNFFPTESIKTRLIEPRVC